MRIELFVRFASALCDLRVSGLECSGFGVWGLGVTATLGGGIVRLPRIANQIDIFYESNIIARPKP